jgi:3-phenylpropionate/trans-cinnamate dioxygenase ferredoxin subunit
MTAVGLTKVCALAELVDGAALRVELAQVDVAVVRAGDEVFAIEDLCSHAEFPLSEGEVDATSIECALHGSRFDLRTGQPSGPPATAPVTVFAVSIRDGDVFLDLENNPA